MVFSGLESVGQNILCFCTVVFDPDQTQFLMCALGQTDGDCPYSPWTLVDRIESSFDFSLGTGRFFRKNRCSYGSSLYAGERYVDP